MQSRIHYIVMQIAMSIKTLMVQKNIILKGEFTKKIQID